MIHCSLQRMAAGHRVCNRRVPRAESLSWVSLPLSAGALSLCHAVHPFMLFTVNPNQSRNLWLDLLIEQRVILDLKAKEQVTSLDKIKVLTYLRLCICT
jgi:hypothetical protein